MSYNTCTWGGLTAHANTWLALGASRVQTYTNTPHGRVEFYSYTRSDGMHEGYAHELLIRARAELPSDASDAQIVERAVILRAKDRDSHAILALAESIQRAVTRGASLSVDGSVQHVHATLGQLVRLAGDAS
jgi:hypothetical protein